MLSSGVRLIFKLITDSVSPPAAASCEIKRRSGRVEREGGQGEEEPVFILGGRDGLYSSQVVKIEGDPPNTQLVVLLKLEKVQ